MTPSPTLPGLPQGAPVPDGELLVDVFTVPAHEGVRGACPKCTNPLVSDDPRVVQGVKVKRQDMRVTCGKCGAHLSVHQRMVQIAL